MLFRSDSNTLTIMHSSYFNDAGLYTVEIPSGVIQGQRGGAFTGLSNYSVKLIGVATSPEIGTGGGGDSGGGGGGGGGGE